MNQKTQHETRTILIVAGGTGGHISPGVALGEELATRTETGYRPVLLSLNKNQNYPDLHSKDWKTFFYNAPPLTKKPLSLVLFPYRIIRALLFSFTLIRKERVKAVIGMGGYSTFPALLAARFAGIPLFLCEQNAAPGKMTLFFASVARKIFLSLPDLDEKIQEFHREKIEITGNPIRKRMIQFAKAARNKMEKGDQEAQESDDPGRDFSRLEAISKTRHPLKILVLGGSQGAKQLNEMVILAMHRLVDCVWQLQAGAAHIDGIQKILREASHNTSIEAFSFDSEIHKRLTHADLVVARAGAGVLTEVSAFGKPMILVPYPFAADNHQRKNAMVYVDAGAAEMIDTDEVDADSLVQKIEVIQSDPVYMRKMGESSAGLARLDASKTIVDRVFEELSFSKNHPDSEQ